MNNDEKKELVSKTNEIDYPSEIKRINKDFVTDFAEANRPKVTGLIADYAGLAWDWFWNKIREKLSA